MGRGRYLSAPPSQRVARRDDRLHCNVGRNSGALRTERPTSVGPDRLFARDPCSPSRPWSPPLAVGVEPLGEFELCYGASFEVACKARLHLIPAPASPPGFTIVFAEPDHRHGEEDV